ncbi:MAG: gliding motility-associated C-terminal domain-containing protein, partial [Crocinitomicaceae bacterium]|nr:gliding motility-associated C-terminal domain-containing protein [Crocinitomicaceae bacterium]
ITRTWTYTDACGNIATTTQTITVDDTTPPTASNPATTTVPGGPAPAVDITVVIDEADNCTANPIVAFVSESTDGVLCPETITRIYSVTDDCGNTINVTHTILITDPFPPTASNPAAINVECITDVPAPDVTVVTDEADNQGVPTVTFVGDVSDNGNCPETIIRTYRVTDACGIFIDVVQTITINVTAGPVVPANGTSTVECIANATQVAAPVVTDQCGNNLIPVITENTDPVCEGDKVYTYTYTDCANNVSVYTYTYTIDVTTFPVVPTNGASTVECLADATQVTAPVVTDVCGNNIAAVITENADPVCEGDKVYTYTYTDCSGLQSVYTYTYTIDVTTSPVVPSNGSEAVVCFADVSVPTAPVVTDVCGNNIAAVMTQNADPVCVGDKIYTFTYTDCAGNISVYTYTFSINDNINPTASNLADISVPGALDVPVPDPLVVTDEADNCTANPVVTWVSDVSDGNVCNLEQITRTYAVTDDCTNQILVTQIITISAAPAPIDAGPDQIICAGDLVTLTADNPLGVSIVWDNNVIDGVPFAPGATGTYTVTADNLGCISTDMVGITVIEPAVVSFTTDNPGGCAPYTVTFTNTTPGSLIDCVWEFSNGTTISGSGCGPVTTTFQNSGLYDVTLTTTVTDPFLSNPTFSGCTSSDTYVDYIYVEDIPEASFIPSSTDLTSLYTEVSFINTSVNATDYLWDFGDASPTSTVVNPRHEFPYEDEGTYVVELIATSPFGCVDTAYATITVATDVIYYVPNTFTPDGDNYNEYFRPVFTSGHDPYDFTLLIFNRWGDIIWESHDDSVGWDGTYGGIPVQDGTYTWKIEFKTTANDERIMVTGHVNVLR